MRALFAFALLAALVACGSEASKSPPPCGSGAYEGAYLLAGPNERGHDAALERKARRHDRAFHALSAFATGLNADLEVPVDAEQARREIVAFLDDEHAYDFETARGRAPTALIAGWQKSAGLYAGAGIAADAFRYAVLRDQGYACAELDVARRDLERAIEGLHRAVAITGVPGVIARSLARTDIAGDGPRFTIVPLFDADGKPLPEEKNNGTWRADQSGLYPNWIWEDSTSRDMLVGWAQAFAAVAEVIRDDPAFGDELKRRLREDATAIARSLMTVRESGYDLEIIDADGRTTFHGYMNENAFERLYIPGVRNGFYANMGFGIAAALAHAAEDAELDRWVDDELSGARDLPGIAAEATFTVDLGVLSNFSNYNMAFTAIWLGLRYANTERARGTLRRAVEKTLYAIPEHERQPSEMKQSFFDFVYVAGMAGAKADAPAQSAFDNAAIARGVETLAEYSDAPYYEELVVNCDEAEIAAKRCTLADGTEVTLLGDVGRGDTLVADRPIPMRVRPPSNYHWRSNPYRPNGDGNGSRLLTAVDFRMAYWLGRFVRAAN